MAATEDRNSVPGIRMGPRAKLQVPEKYADRFRVEAEQVLGSIAGSIKETTDRAELARDRLEPATWAVDDDDLAIFDGARSVFVQSREQDGELAIEGPAYTLREVASGCATAAAEELFHGLSGFDFQPYDLIEEIEHWRDRIAYMNDQFEAENGDGGES